MRIGLIARAETARGLGVQTRNFYDHMPVSSTLLIDMPNPDGPVDPDGYRDALRVPYDARTHTLPEETVRDWLSTVDVVFTVETPYDWRLPDWAREAGARSVVQGNPEFYRHHLPSHAWQAQPDRWWWPTSWRPVPELPRGDVVPVPVDLRPVTARDPDDRAPLRLLHVVGRRAFLDRNGTDTLIQAMRGMRRPVELTIHSLDLDLPPDLPRHKRVTYHLRTGSAVDDRWAMYDDQTILVLPRKYGGLCLPALEAAASGLAVLMPTAAHNVELGASLLVDARGRRPANLSCGRVDLLAVNPLDLANMLSSLTAEQVACAQQTSRANVPTWDEWRPRYLAALEALA